MCNPSVAFYTFTPTYYYSCSRAPIPIPKDPTFIFPRDDPDRGYIFCNFNFTYRFQVGQLYALVALAQERISGGQERWNDHKWSITLGHPLVRRVECKGVPIQKSAAKKVIGMVKYKSNIRDGEYRFEFSDVEKMMGKPLRLFRDLFGYKMPMFSVGIYVKDPETEEREAVLVGQCRFQIGLSVT